MNGRSVNNQTIFKLRKRAQTDLFWLAKDVLKKDLRETTHRAVCDFFVQKNPDLPLQQQDNVKGRLLLYPRGSYKTTIDIVDAVQWTICFPDIRILFLTGEKGLALAMLQEYRDYFVIRDKPTVFQQLFPEFCIELKNRMEREFTTPARQKQFREPTAMYNSIDSALSGWHYDVIKTDDVLTNENTGTIDQLEKVRKNYYLNMKMCMTYGYKDVSGTRYSVNDLYGYMIEKDRHRVLCKSAIWAKESPDKHVHEGMLRDASVRSSEILEANYELLFPEVLSFKFLMEERHSDIDSFCSQYLNDPSSAADVTFTIEQLRQQTIPPTQVPKEGRIFICWDLAYSIKKGRDFSVGAVGLIDKEGRLFVHEIIRGRYVTHSLVYAIVDAIRRWNPELTDIEDSLGTRWLLSDIERKAAELNVPLRIDWFPAPRNKDAKDARIKSLEALLAAKRMYFVSTIQCLDVVYKELVEYGQATHDDTADAISYLATRHVPKTVMAESLPEEQEKAFEDLRQKDLRDMIYRIGKYEEPEKEEVVAPKVDPYALEEIAPGLNC